MMTWEMQRTVRSLEHYYLVGVGAANIDVSGKSRQPINLHDSNPGFLVTSCGGVTRNVCENLARLGADARLITALGADVYAEKIRRESAAAGIDLSNAFVVPDHASSSYVNLLDEHGDMLVAMSDMSILQLLPPAWLEEKKELLRGARFVTCDPALSEQTMTTLLDLCEGYVPVYVDPVSCAYAQAVKPHIGRFHTAKPNRMELEILSGRKIRNRDDLRGACESVLEQGLQRVFVSLGEEGCFYMDRTGRTMERKLRPVTQMANATGGGDAFMAAVIYSSAQSLSLEQTLDNALAAGIAAVTCRQTINPEMSPELLKKILKEYRI